MFFFRKGADNSDVDVVYFSLNFPELSQTFVFNEMRSLRDGGANLRIVALKREIQAPSDLPHQYGLSKDVDYLNTNTGIKARFSRLFDVIKSLIVLERRSLNALLSIRDLRSAARKSSTSVAVLLRLAAHLQPKGSNAVIHCHFGTTGIVVAELKKLGLVTAPFTTVFHGFDITKFVDANGRDIYTSLFEVSDFLLPVSELWRGKLIQLNAPRDRIRVQRLGVDCSAFEFQERFLTPTSEIRFVVVGRMTEKKGHRYAIQAFADLVARRPDLEVRLDVIGAGPLLEELNALAESSPSADKICLHGAMPNSMVRQFLDRSHVFVLPSVTAADGDMEGIPVAIMEAMAMGLPIVSTLHSGIPEIVADGVSGLLVPEKDIGALSAAMENLASNRHLISQMGKQGRDIVERDYNEVSQGKSLISLMSELQSRPV
ncbi:glycosyltransferase [Agrobacterium sp. AGB01]|nr:glycosyltransferase [Agrobacterium sp. AGB01]